MRVERTRHGPIERIVLLAPGPERPAQTSAWRIGDVLVDAGGSRMAAALVEALRDQPPRRIVCTHQHEDHVGGVGALRRAFGALPVHAPRPHVGLLRTFDCVPEYRAAAWGAPEPVVDAIPIDEGDMIEALGVRFAAVATPGHTPGHLAFVAQVGDDVFALTGDLYITVRPLAAWFESAADDLLRSWRALVTHGASLRLLPTHGRVRDDGARALREAAEFVERHAEIVRTTAERLGTLDPAAVSQAAFGDEGPLAVLSGGEFSYAAFARSVLAPVRALPTAPPSHVVGASRQAD